MQKNWTIAVRLNPPLKTIKKRNKWYSNKSIIESDLMDICKNRQGHRQRLKMKVEVQIINTSLTFVNLMQQSLWKLTSEITWTKINMLSASLVNIALKISYIEIKVSNTSIKKGSSQTTCRITLNKEEQNKKASTLRILEEC